MDSDHFKQNHHNRVSPHPHTIIHNLLTIVSSSATYPNEATAISPNHSSHNALLNGSFYTC